MIRTTHAGGSLPKLLRLEASNRNGSLFKLVFATSEQCTMFAALSKHWNYYAGALDTRLQQMCQEVCTVKLHLSATEFKQFGFGTLQRIDIKAIHSSPFA